MAKFVHGMFSLLRVKQEQYRMKGKHATNVQLKGTSSIIENLQNIQRNILVYVYYLHCNQDKIKPR